MNLDSAVRQLRALARIMDDAVAIPGTRFRFGLDAIIGLVPGVGDAAAALVAGYALIAALRAGAPRSLLARMAGNILLDTAVGSIPVFGDAFDFAFRSNRRNLRLLEQYSTAPDRTRTRSRALLIAAATALGLALIGVIALSIWLARLIIGALS